MALYLEVGQEVRYHVPIGDSRYPKGLNINAKVQFVYDAGDNEEPNVDLSHLDVSEPSDPEHYAQQDDVIANVPHQTNASEGQAYWRRG